MAGCMTPAAEHQATKIVMGALKELLRDNTYCYASTSAHYSELKPAGEQYVLSVVRIILPLLVQSQQDVIRDAAESLMMTKLQT